MQRALIAMLLAIPALTAAGAEPGAAPASAPPIAPYLLIPTDSGVTACWTTPGPSRGAVRFRADESAPWAELAERSAGRLHSVRMTGFPAGKRVQAEALTGPGGDALGRLEWQSTPTAGEGFGFIVFGDTQWRAGFERIAGVMLAEGDRRRCRFVLHVGDLSNDSAVEKSLEKDLFRPGAALFARLPLVPVRGNHDPGELFESLFRIPADSRGRGGAYDYCLDYGPVRLIVLDGNVAARTGDSRMKWLAARLAEAGDRWRLVAIHQPLYSRGHHAIEESSDTPRALLEPYLVAGRVHAVFSGHDHSYQRSRPVKGVTHFISSIGYGPGECLPAVPADDWSARYEQPLNFLAVDVAADKLTVRAFHPLEKGSGTFGEFDSVEIPRDCGWPAVDWKQVRPVKYNYDAAERIWLKIVVISASSVLLVVALTIRIIQRRRAQRGTPAADLKNSA